MRSQGCESKGASHRGVSHKGVSNRSVSHKVVSHGVGHIDVIGWCNKSIQGGLPDGS